MKKCPYCGSRLILGHHNGKYYLALSGDLAAAFALGLINRKLPGGASFTNTLDDRDKKERYYCLSCHETFF